ncbi:TIGR03790 family protein [Methylomonas sp. LL1]|uniref:TIGR03790 family protein n=1 Tax=Methylomonas sp. LL1 TaxID=2785785 RepID=UPI0018C36243|nr:TIGR03790 family protein [Methylomonas sp. LL1]QPK62199.1 TIGR03790 family protein [Methylomonas sp. LL1]
MSVVKKFVVAFCCLLLINGFGIEPLSAQVSPLYRPATALAAKDLAIIVNDNDPLSQQIADYYRQMRKIPPEQLIHIRLPARRAILTKGEFEHIKQQVDEQTPKHVQVFALTWLQPFRVECMSITTAFAAGFDPAFCSEGCQQTRKSPYYASEAAKPFDKHAWRPTMVLAAHNLAEAKKLIDRGIAADFSRPSGSAYLLKTSDQARSSRAGGFKTIAEKFNPFWPVNYLEQDYIAGHQDVMFYFTGLISVPHIGENHFLPGAVADHLTSAGGVMSGSSQMNIMEWLKAGATGSYGAVVEPCNFPAKFPNPGVLMYHYLRGSTLIEAYWKSVAQPGQGIFVGEPLAKPFAFPVQMSAN